MSRIRAIKPEFFLHDGLSELKPIDRLLFIGLWTIADKSGRLKDRVKTIKIQILPYDNHDVDKALDQLAARGFIHRYRVGEDNFIQIVNWDKHQRPHHTEKESDLPPKPIDNGEEPVRARPTCIMQASHTPTPTPTPTQEGECEGEKKKLAADEIFAYWQTELNHPRAMLDKKRRIAIEARLKEGYTVDRIKQAIRGIQNIPHNMGKNDRETVYDDIELICRSGANVDRFADREENYVKRKSVVEAWAAKRGINIAGGVHKGNSDNRNALPEPKTDGDELGHLADDARRSD